MITTGYQVQLKWRGRPSTQEYIESEIGLNIGHTFQWVDGTIFKVEDVHHEVGRVGQRYRTVYSLIIAKELVL